MKPLALFTGLVLFVVPGYSQPGVSDAGERELIEVLQTGSNWETMDQAFRGLQIIGAEASVPVLARYLDDMRWSHLNSQAGSLQQK